MSERNKFIHEVILKECWHRWTHDAGMTMMWRNDHNEKQCVKCSKWYPWHQENPSYSTNWQDYGKLIEHCKRQEWWAKFKEWLAMQCLGLIDKKPIEEMEYSDDIMLDPDRGSLVIARFNGWEGE